MNNKEYLDDTLKLWNYAVSELEEMQNFFSFDKLNDHFYRRIILRNLFAIIETYLFISRELVRIKIAIDGNTENISWQEQSLLVEKKVGLNSNGKVIEKDEFQSFIPAFRFTITIFSKTFGVEPPDFGNNHFGVLQALVKRRNDVTHPKSYSDVKITDQEIKDLIPMYGWFMNIHGKTYKHLLKWLELVYPTLIKNQTQE